MSPNSATSQKSVQSAIKDLTKFIRKLDTVPTEELTKSAITIKAEAVAQTPYRTGKLERSVYVMVSKDRRRTGLRAGATRLAITTPAFSTRMSHINIR